MIRLVDFWARLHAASVIDSAGLGLILLGMILQAGFTLIAAKLALIVQFLFVTGPTASHAVANAAPSCPGRAPGKWCEDETAFEEPKAKTAKKTKKRVSKARKKA